MKFRTKPTDRALSEIVRQIEDQVASREDVAVKDNSVKVIQTAEPTNKEMKDGERRIYDDGTNQWYYRKVGGRLFKIQCTEVT